MFVSFVQGRTSRAGGRNLTAPGGLQRESAFHCFSRKAMGCTSPWSWLVVSLHSTPGTHGAPTGNARVGSISVVFGGAECQVTKSCPGRRAPFPHLPETQPGSSLFILPIPFF